MKIEEEHGAGGGIAWRLRWWEAGRPRSRVFADKADADAFRKEVRRRRRVVGLHTLKLLIAALVFAAGVVLLLDVRDREPVAAAFIRVGGATRVETSIEGARFWFAPGPRFVVETRQDADADVMWRSAWCAVAHDAPLLFTPTKASRKPLVDNTLDSWPSHPRRLEVTDPTDCPATDEVHAPPRLSTLHVASASVVSQGVVQGEQGVRHSNVLAPLVVFAAAKTPSDAPDVAVGLTLAAHLARERDVSLVVVPRYLQADRELEEALPRRRHGS